MPRGFEVHTMREHNFANYMFFLKHLLNKPDTEYTGQVLLCLKKNLVNRIFLIIEKFFKRKHTCGICMRGVYGTFSQLAIALGNNTKVILNKV